MLRRINKLVWIGTLAVLGLVGCWKEDDGGSETGLFKSGRGIIPYAGYAPLNDKPINIHYYIPASGNAAEMSILLVFPGTNRNADDYLTPWIAVADRKKMMVFSLEFPAATYSASQYIEGGMFSGAALLPESAWTFSMIEPLFEYIKEQTGSRRTGYDIFGHSAGAQFVHRYMTFKPDNRVDRAIAANAGWYTLPDFTVEYPYGLKNSPATEAGLRRFFAKKFFLQLGTSDTDTDDSNLNKTPGAMEQGAYRYARGLYYWEAAEQAKGSAPFNWEKVLVPNVGHEYRKMIAAAEQLF